MAQFESFHSRGLPFYGSTETDTEMRDTAGVKHEQRRNEEELEGDDVQTTKPGAYSMREMALIRQEQENEIGEELVGSLSLRATAD